MFQIPFKNPCKHIPRVQMQHPPSPLCYTIHEISLEPHHLSLDRSLALHKLILIEVSSDADSSSWQAYLASAKLLIIPEFTLIYNLTPKELKNAVSSSLIVSK